MKAQVFWEHLTQKFKSLPYIKRPKPHKVTIKPHKITIQTFYFHSSNILYQILDLFSQKHWFCIIPLRPRMNLKQRSSSQQQVFIWFTSDFSSLLPTKQILSRIHLCNTDKGQENSWEQNMQTESPSHICKELIYTVA